MSDFILKNISSRAISGLALWALVALWGASARAQAPPGGEEDPRHRVYVVPRMELVPDPDQIGEGLAQVDTAALTQAAQDYFQGQPERFVVIDPEALFARFDATAREGSQGVSSLRFFLNVQKAETNLQSGVKALGRFDLKDAERSLLEAVRLYEEVQAPLLLPAELARVYEYLGLVYVEQGQREEEAIRAFVQMLRLDGRRVLVHPYYHEATEALYREARARLLEGRGGGADDADRAELAQVSQLLGAHIVLWGFVEQRGEALILHLQLHRREGDATSFPAPESIPLTRQPDVDRERADRLASRFAACVEPLPVAPPPPPDRERGRFYLDSTFAYLLYLEPFETLFHNFGFTLTGSYMVLENFSLLARLSLLDGGNDGAESLIKSPLSARMFLGAGFALRPVRWLRLMANFAVEGNFVSELQTTDEFFCKVDRAANGCSPSDIQVEPPTWYLGVNTQLGLGIQLYRDLFLVASGGFSFYAWPLEGGAVNYPLSGDLGLGYRF
jgi:tetratricopeptide (TPR) repeat protein